MSQSGSAANCVAEQIPVNYYAMVNEYFPHGAAKQLTLGNGLVENHGANNRLQWTSVAVGVLFSATLTFGTPNNGNPATQAIVRSVNGQSFAATQNYGYDSVNRLKTANEGANWNQTYVYDARGNRAVLGSSTIPSGTRTPQVSADAEAQVESLFLKNRWAEGIGGQSYDLAGNQTGELGGRTFQYDAENRLVQASLPVGATTIVTSFVYDGNGRRVKKTVGGAETRYVYDGGGNLLLELGTGTGTTNTSYLTQDWLGSTRMVTSESGQVKECLDYFPFGEEVGPAIGSRPSCYQGVANPSVTVAGRMEQRFTSKERDAETGLDYFGARYMASAQGRFTSADPVNHPSASKNPRSFLTNPQRWNGYSYVANNPLMYVDPDGRELRITIFNSSNFSRDTVTRAGEHMAGKFREAGVQNVSVVVKTGRPGFLDYVKASVVGASGFITGKQHSHLLEIRPDKMGSGSGSQDMPKNEGGHNFGGNSALDARQVSINASSDKEAVLGLGNIGAHEIAHDLSPFHSEKGPTDIMQQAADPAFMFSPNLQFTQAWQRGLRRRFNTSEEQKQIDEKKTGQP